MNLYNKKINFLGDSITQGCGTSSEKEKRFSTLISNNTGALCRNYGIGGTRIARQKHPSENPICDKDFCQRATEMDPDADIVVVFGGTNDFGHGDAPIGSMDDRCPDTFYGALHTLCAELLERYPTSDIVFITPLHRTNEDNPKGDGTKTHDGKILADYIDIIREVTRYYSLPLLDLYSTSQLQPNLPIIRQRYMPDGLHPNDEGHKLIAKKIVSFLESL